MLLHICQEENWCSVLISLINVHVLTEVLSDPAVTSRLADVKATGEVRALDEFYQMLQNDPDRAFYGWGLLSVFLIVIYAVVWPIDCVSTMWRFWPGFIFSILFFFLFRRSVHILAQLLLLEYYVLKVFWQSWISVCTGEGGGGGDGVTFITFIQI